LNRIGLAHWFGLQEEVAPVAKARLHQSIEARDTFARVLGNAS